MPKQLLILFAITAILFACKQTETDEKKYTSREWDSITKAKHEYEFDSALSFYRKEHPKAFYPMTLEHKFLLLKATTYTSEKHPITVEHRIFPRNCIDIGLLYIYDDTASQIIEIPWHSMMDTTHKLISLSNDFNSMIKKFKLKYDTGFNFVDIILLTNLSLRRIGPNESGNLSTYEEYIRHIAGCEDLCLENLSNNIQKIKSYLKVENMRVYTDGLKFINAKVTYNNNIPKVEFEIINPECNCRICW